MSSERNHEASRVIDALGGTAAVARLCRVQMPSVTNWRKNGIPEARMMYLQAVCGRQLRRFDVSAATSQEAAAA